MSDAKSEQAAATTEADSKPSGSNNQPTQEAGVQGQPCVRENENGSGESHSVESPTEGEESLEKLEEKLKAMEEEQSKLAQQIEAAGEGQRLDSHLAVIEEQFRRSFEDRYTTPAAARGGSGRPLSFISRFDTGSGADIDLIKLNGIFRDVSRDLGEDWRPVFDELTRSLSPELVSQELARIEQMQPIIRGYRSLNVWKELSGPDFNVRLLVEALRKTDHNDIADAIVAVLEGAAEAPKSKPVTRRKSDVSSRSRTAALDNRRMLLLAKKLGGDWEELGRALGLPEEELAEIKEGPDASTYQGAFKVLWAWRQTQPEIEQASSVEALRSALITANKQTLAEQLQAS